VVAFYIMNNAADAALLQICSPTAVAGDAATAWCAGRARRKGDPTAVAAGCCCWLLLPKSLLHWAWNDLIQKLIV
jgi:hypothetical protein